MASTIKVNNIQNQCGANIVNKCSTTITLGASGDTVTLASGASQSGFGRTGTVNWDTTAKTANFTAVSGNGYFVNTTSGAITVTLPASPSAGDIVAVKDYAGTFNINNMTFGRNGSPINGANSADPVISTAGASIFLVYVDGTRGWVATQDDSSTFSGESFIVATGGTITTCGDYKIHTFTAPGTFTVCSVSGTPTNNAADYLVVAGGGGGGQSANADNGGGGGAGGFRESSGTSTGCYTASPLGACVSAITLTATGYPITVGAGGTAGTGANNPTAIGGSGSNSVFSTITSTGGGGGGGNTPSRAGVPGGSGGGAGGGLAINNPGGSGNTPPVSPPQGNNGSNSAPGPSPDQAGGGGGGATEAGQVAGSTSADGGRGGAGATTSISGSPTAYAGGAGTGCGAASPCGTGGAGGNATTGGAGTTNRGGGGGGVRCAPTAGAGGSGIVIIRYKYQ